MANLYPANRSCWEKYSKQIRNFYLQSYSGKISSSEDAEFARRAVLWVFDTEKYFPTVSTASMGFYDQMQTLGASTYGAATCQQYFENTINSYLKHCQEETGGFAPTVACTCDSDCPSGYRCRGVGETSECVKKADPPPDPDPWWKSDPDPAPAPASGPCPRGREYQAPLFGGCDPGYYREKSWGRDMCVCEEGASAETGFDKLGDFFSGNIKMLVIGMVAITIAIFAIKMRSG